MAKLGRPRKPSGEDPTITVKLQDLQLKTLTDRIGTLSNRLDEAASQNHRLLNENSSLKNQVKNRDDKIADMGAVHDRLRGWIDCAREILGCDRTVIEAKKPRSLREVLRSAMKEAPEV